MRPSSFNLLRSNRTFGLALGALTTIILGALSIGLWEFLLHPLFASLGNFALNLVATLWGGYVDILHADIGKLSQDEYEFPSFLLIGAFVICAPWVLVAYIFRGIASAKRLIATENVEKEELTIETIKARIDGLAVQFNRLRKQTLMLLVPIVLSTTVVYALIFWQIGYTRNASIWADRSIEILRPQISVEEHLKLRAGLRAVSDASQFYDLELQLKALAVKTNTRLPAFIAIRRLGTT